MPDEARGQSGTASRPLTGVTVLEVVGHLGAYAGRLLADLGAEVIRLETGEGDDELRLGPFELVAHTGVVSLFERFVNAGKRSVGLDLGTPEGGEILDRLLGSVDVLLVGPGLAERAHGLSEEHLASTHPNLIRVVVSPYGADRPAGDGADDDLLLLARGGLLHLGGYRDAGPVAPFGSQSSFMTSIFAAVAALSGLLDRDQHGRASVLDVSAQECVAQALEDSVVGYALTGQIRQAQGEMAKEAGTGVYRCADGYVSVVAGRLGTASAWSALVEWLAEEGTPGADELVEGTWSSFRHRQSDEAIERFRDVFERFASSRTREELYLEAQRRRIALSPVNDMAAVLGNDQLGHREFFTSVPDPVIGQDLVFPRAPYRFSATPLDDPGPPPKPGSSTVSVLTERAGLDSDTLQVLAARGVV